MKKGIVLLVISLITGLVSCAIRNNNSSSGDSSLEKESTISEELSSFLSSDELTSEMTSELTDITTSSEQASNIISNITSEIISSVISEQNSQSSEEETSDNQTSNSTLSTETTSTSETLSTSEITSQYNTSDFYESGSSEFVSSIVSESISSEVSSLVTSESISDATSNITSSIIESIESSDIEISEEETSDNQTSNSTLTSETTSTSESLSTSEITSEITSTSESLSTSDTLSEESSLETTSQHTSSNSSSQEVSSNDSINVNDLSSLKNSFDSWNSNYTNYSKTYLNEEALKHVNKIYSVNYIQDKIVMSNLNYRYLYNDENTINVAYFNCAGNSDIKKVSLYGDSLEERFNSVISDSNVETLLVSSTIEDYFIGGEDFTSSYVDEYGAKDEILSDGTVIHYEGWTRITNNKYKCDRLEVIDDILKVVAPDFTNEGMYMTFSHVTVEIDPMEDVNLRIRLYAEPTQIGKLIEEHLDQENKPNLYLLFAESLIGNYNETSIPAIENFIVNSK